MGELCLFVKGISDKEKFLNKLRFEAGAEITTDVKDDKIVFHNIDNVGREKLCTVLAEKIFLEYCKKVLVRIINKNCDYLSKFDKSEIWKMSLNKIKFDENESNSEHLYRILTVKNKLADFLSSSEYFSLEGFANFRLSEFDDDMEEIVEECIQNYLVELEYLEFINMLKYFISVQNSTHYVVDVFYGNDILIFGDGKNITKKCVDDFEQESVYKEKNEEDFILNSLIGIAPKRVNIYEQNKTLSKEIKKTLLGIFGDKLKITTE